MAIKLSGDIWANDTLVNWCLTMRVDSSTSSA